MNQLNALSNRVEYYDTIYKLSDFIAWLFNISIVLSRIAAISSLFPLE